MDPIVLVACGALVGGVYLIAWAYWQGRKPKPTPTVTVRVQPILFTQIVTEYEAPLSLEDRERAGVEWRWRLARNAEEARA